MLKLFKRLFNRKPKHSGTYDPILSACSMVNEMDCMIRNQHISPHTLNKIYNDSGVAYEFCDGHLSSVVVESSIPMSPLFDYEVKSR